MLFRDPRPSLWGVGTPSTTCRLAHPASSLANSSDERVRSKSRLLANQSALSVDLLSLVATENPRVALVDLEKRSLGRI